MKSSTNLNQRSYLTDLYSTNAVKSRRLSLLMLMLLTLLFVPTRMVAQTTTDPRCALFNDLDGITDVTITDDGDYPWQMLNLGADGMTNLGFTIPDGSKGLMSSNYNKDNSKSKSIVKFRVEKPILLTFKFLVSSEKDDKATITLDTKESWKISEKKQREIKALLSVGEHSLELTYSKDYSDNAGADRAFIYDLKTAITISDYVAVSDATNTTLTFKYLTSNDLKSLNCAHIAIVNNERTVQELCTNYNGIKKIVFDKSFAGYAPTSLRDFFEGCGALKTILNIENLNTTKVTDMSSMFYGCSALTSLDLSNFNTANVTDMACMFDYCWNLSSLNLSKFNTEKVTNMAYMFSACYKLSSLDLSKLNTANVTNMANMFTGCYALASLDLTNFNTAKVTNMSEMFRACTALTSLDLTKFNTEKVTNMSGMFYNCKKLSSLDLSKFNTEKVTTMAEMFYGCSALTSLDLTNFNTANVTYISYMFKDCSSLTTIYASDKFKTTKVNEYGGSNMFSGCKLLKGYEGTKTSSKYANYTTGYFSKLVGKNGDEKIGAVGETLTAEKLVLDDDKDFVAYEPFAVKAASYSRTMKEGTTWATLCLPFEVSLDGQNFRAFKLLSADDAKETVELEELKTIEAGTPVIIKMKDGETQLKFSVANKNIAKDVQTSKTADGNYQLQGLYTQKEFSKDADNNCYIVKGNKLMNPAKLLENTKVTRVVSTPFRAYMVDNTSSAAGAKMFNIGFDNDGTTAIDSLNTIANDNAIYYDLQGKRLNEPQKGINIVKRNGKTMKVIIK